MSVIADRVVPSRLWWKGSVWFNNVKSWRANLQWVIPPTLSCLAPFLYLPWFCSNTPSNPGHPTFYKHNKMKNLSPIPAFQPCLHSLEKWELDCVSVPNTVSTASASDWFTASLAWWRLTGLLDSFSFAQDQFTTNTQQLNLWMTHFH